MTTITLLRAVVEQALEALEQSETTVPYEGFGMARREAERKHQAAITALRAALAQQAEPVEPVAWVRLEAWKSGKYWPDDCFTALPAEGLTPVYTPPPQRKPLTEEEIAAEWQKASECASKSEGAVTTSQFVQMFARAIERAHGIPMSEAPACPDCHGVGYDASGQLCACQENPSF